MRGGVANSEAVETLPLAFDDDPRWQLVQRIVASRQFSKAPLLSKFLIHISSEILQGRQSEISEYQIGVQVFDRPLGYRTVEDNIVRNYARQLRKRLSEYFAGEGRLEPIQVEIPLGGYVPVFQTRVDEFPASNAEHSVLPAANEAPASAKRTPSWLHSRSARAVMLLAYSVAIASLTLFIATRYRDPQRPYEPSKPLWNSLFHSPLDTFVVPADSGFNILEDLGQKDIGLADYLKGDYQTLPLPVIDAHSAADLRTQQYTSFVDLEVVAALSRLPEIDPRRFFLRFPRDLRMDDLKNSNVILIGSISSNPWAEVAQKNMNFRIAYRSQIQEAWIENTKPLPAESAVYVSHWNEPSHETYALISFQPNLSGNGHLLLIQGLDIAGTQAAAETLFRKDTIAPILRQASSSNGGVRSFEILLQCTSIDSNAANTKIIASRIY